MSLDQVQSISLRGHEIGGHTLTHSYLTQMTFAQQKAEICTDRNQLLALGLSVTNFAFPFGADTLDSPDILSQCGYNGARDSGGIRGNTSCTACPKSDSIIPANPFLIRSVPYSSTVGVEGMKWYVQQALTDPLYAGGVLPFIFHEYGVNTGAASGISPTELLQFIDWAMSQSNVVFNTLDSVVNKRVYPNFDLMPIPPVSALGKPYVAFTFDFATNDHMNVSQLWEQHWNSRLSYNKTVEIVVSQIPRTW